jgi:hypothetical protein
MLNSLTSPNRAAAAAETHSRIEDDFLFFDVLLQYRMLPVFLCLATTVIGSIGIVYEILVLRMKGEKKPFRFLPES